MKKKVLILGGTKFVGRQLVEKLINDPAYEVYLFNRGKTNPNLFSNITLLKGDRETDDINQIKNYNWDYVIDFSSFFPQSLRNTILNLNKDLTKYIYISSISAYALLDYDSSFEIPEDYKLKSCSKNEASDTSMKTYGKRKAACEQVLQEFQWLNKIILRPSIIYGSYDWSDRIYYWLYRVKNNYKMILPDSGNDKWSLTYSTDLVNLILKSLKSPVVNGIYNCSSGKPIELIKLIECMAVELETAINNKVANIPQDWLVKNGVKPQNDIPLWVGGNVMLENTKIKDDFDFHFVPIEKTIKEIIEYYEGLNWQKPNIGLNQNDELKLIEDYKKCL